MVVIRKLILKQSYRYVWLKYVSGFDLSQHCAKCLKGTYDPRICRNVFHYENLELPPSPYYYFCTVQTYPTNIHLAFEEAEGEEVIYEDHRYSVIIENARQIRFDESRINQALPQARLKAYNTCRNWQFANWILAQNDVSKSAP